MKKYMQALLPLMLAASLGEDKYKKTMQTEIDPELEREKIELNKLQQLKKKGLKEFTIDGITVFALNYKNAVKKVNKLK